MLSHGRGDLDCDLLEYDGGVERIHVCWQEPVDKGLLMLFSATNLGERELELSVHARAGMGEPKRLRFDAVHKNDAHLRERIVVELAHWRLHEVAPGKCLPIEWGSSFSQYV
jgi:hypothetical protein